jgi:hypothetical protein
VLCGTPFLTATSPQTYAPADGGTFDLGEALVIKGRETKVHLGCLRLDYSAIILSAPCLPSERQEALFECHLQGFSYLGGTPGRMRYDNLRPAVQKILRGKNRQEQAVWVAFRSHFVFESEYVIRVKGGVENLVGYVRRNFLVPPPEFDDYEALNAYLMNCCDRDARERRRGGRMVEELWRKEQESLRPLPQKLPTACVSRPGKVNRRQQVGFAGNWYPVPNRYVEQVVTIRAYVFRVRIALAGPGDRLP